MKKLLDPAYWGRALRNPKVLVGLAIDLVPIYAVLVWGWGAAPLVLLYWVENLVAGGMTLPRIFISGANFGVAGMAVSLFMCVFFVFHYGLFCAVHGTFLMVFLELSGDTGLGTEVMNVPAMVRSSLASGQHMIWVVGLIVVWQFILLVWDFGVRGEWRDANPMGEMFAPYGRIVVLHIGLFVGMGGLILLGQPMVGVLALILFRAVWGVTQNAGEKSKDMFDTDASVTRDQFAAMLRGEKPPEA